MKFKLFGWRFELVPIKPSNFVVQVSDGMIAELMDIANYRRETVLELSTRAMIKGILCYQKERQGVRFWYVDKTGAVYPFSFADDIPGDIEPEGVLA